MLRLEGDPWAAADSSHALLAGFVQFLQYYYQSGCLYRLRALGERHNMDLTVGKWDVPLLVVSGCQQPPPSSGPVLSSLGAVGSTRGNGDTLV